MEGKTARRGLALTLLAALLCALLAGCGGGETAERPSPAQAKIGAMTGSTGADYIAAAWPEADLNSFDGIPDAIAALQSGKLDYVVTAYTTAVNYTRADPGLEIVQKDLNDEGSAMAISKDNADLTKRIDAVLDRFASDGTLDDLVARWVREDGSAYERAALPPAEGGQTLTVGIAANREPMCFVDGDGYAGLDIELIERVADELHMDVAYLDMQFSALIPALQGGKIDVAISNLSPTPERREMVDFTREYFKNPQVLLARRIGNGQSITSLSQLDGKRVGVITGSVFDQVVQDKAPGAQVEYYNTNPDMAVAIEAGKLDALVTDEPMARMLAAANPAVTLLPELLERADYAFALPKGKEALRDALNGALTEMQADGTLAALDEKWFGADESAKVLPELDDTGTEQTLRLATFSASEPFSYVKDGQVVGYDIETAMLAAHRIGCKIEVMDMAFAGVIPSLQGGKADLGACCITVTPERQQEVLFTQPNYHGGVSAVVSSGRSAEIGVFQRLQSSFTKTFLTENRWKLVVQGLWVTVFISVLSAALGTLLGFGLCFLLRSRCRLARFPAKALCSIMEGVPIVVVLMILFYLVFGSVDLAPALVAVAGFGLDFGVSVAGMLRTGIEGVDRGELEAARAMGFRPARVFLKITLPQVVRRMLPMYRGNFVSLFKMTSIVGYIAIQDLTKVSDIIRSRTFEAFFPLVATALIYFLISHLIASLLQLLQARLDPKRRPKTIKGVTSHD